MAENLAALRETYDEAQDSLSIEYATEFSEGIALRNAIEAADELIAAQQQRIAELEKGLADTESMLYQANQLLVSSWSFMLNHNLIKPDDRAQTLIDVVERWNVEYAMRKSADMLRAEKGGEG